MTKDITVQVIRRGGNKSLNQKQMPATKMYNE